jgi:Phage P22-like portal protein
MAPRPPRDSAPPGPDTARPQAAAGSSEVVSEAYDRFKRCQKKEQTARQRFVDDYKFANADAYNGYQWPNDLRRTREVDDRPTLTLNGAWQHNMQIINDAKQNKPGIKVMATGGGASFESAQALSALVRHIEYTSNATVAYDTATHFQVHAGWGYIRVETDYSDGETFDQDVFIRRVKDPLMVYLDPDAREADRSDMKFAFIFEDYEREEFARDPRFSDFADLATMDPLGDAGDWIGDDYIRIADYFRVVEREDTLYALPRGFGHGAFPGGFIRRSVLVGGRGEGRGVPNVPRAVRKALLAAVEKDPNVRSRPLVVPTVEWKLIVGNQVVDEATWPGKYIPIVPVWGEESNIEGTWDCVSHTRRMLDAQKMYNYAASSAVEFMGLQTKTPWLVATESIEELETYWNEANRINTSALPFKAFREDGSAIPPPQRIAPPTAAPIYAQQMQASLQDLLMTSGQFAAQMGAQGNERSAKAIGERQRQSDNATYHFVDNLAIAIRHLGRIVLDLIPHIYDTQRVLQVLAEDGTTMEMMLDPRAKQAYQKLQAENEKTAQHVLNVNVGRYEVQADVGPNYATRREEAFDAFKLILTQSPQLSSILGDILFRAGDFPHAEEAAARLRRMVPPAALGEGPSTTEQAQQQTIQNLQNLLSNAMTELAAEKLKLRGKEAKDEVAVYAAFTDRLKVLVDAAAKGEAQVTPETLKPILGELLTEMGLVDLSQTGRDVEGALNGASLPTAGLPLAATRTSPPVAGAKQDAFGRWFARDFSRSRDYRPV